jgi:hypothetical protein
VPATLRELAAEGDAEVVAATSEAPAEAPGLGFDAITAAVRAAVVEAAGVVDVEDSQPLMSAVGGQLRTSNPLKLNLLRHLRAYV